MTEYLLVNSAVGATALLGLLLLRSTPPRVNMWVCLIALSVWLVPWQIISISWSQPVLAAYSTWAPPLGSQEAGSLTSPELEFQWSQFFWMAFAAVTLLGLGVFLLRWVNLLHLLKRWRANAEPASNLWLRHGFMNETTPIRVVQDFDNAFVSGYFRSEVWLGYRQVESPAIGSILCHERAHIRQHDNFVLLVATLFRDVFWWNPLVRLLSYRTRQYMELSCDQRCLKTAPSYQKDMALELLDVRNGSATVGLMTPLFLTRRFNIYRIRQLDKEFSVKKRHFGLLCLMMLLGCSAVIPATVEHTPDATAILNHLTITTAPNERDQSTVAVEFIGEPEVRKLLELAKLYAVDVELRMEDELRRVIRLKSHSHDDTHSVLAAFDGTPMEGFFRNDVVTELGKPLLVDVVFKENEEDPFEVTLASTTGQWAGISRGDYLFRVRTMLITNGDREDVSFWVEISERVEGELEVVARPRVITRIEEVATIRSGNDHSTILLTLKARKSS